MKLRIGLAALSLFLFSSLAFTQVPVGSPSPSASPVASVSPSPSPVSSAGADFLSQVVAVVKSWGGLSSLLKISAVIALLIASMKVSFLNSLIWAKLGGFQVYLAPVLGLIGGLLSIGVSGPVTIASVFLYASAGGGAVFLHEILDSIKAIPGLGAVYVSLINTIESDLGGPASQAPASKA